MKIAPVVVLYKPQELSIQNIINNILSYSQFCRMTFIVDNSSEDNTFITKYIPNSIYIHNKNKGGIAGALNRGIEEAIKHDFDYILTMDQDSSFEKGMFEKYVKQVRNNISFADSFTLKLNLPAKKNTSLFKWPREYIPDCIKKIVKYKLLKKTMTEPAEEKEIVFVEKCFTSGNIISAEIWNKTGFFDEDLFIDEVDFDFCSKIILVKGKILKFNNCSMNHILGNQFFSVFPKCYYTKSRLRFYYIIRNKFIQKFRYESKLKVHDYKKEIRDFFIDYCIFNIKAPVYLWIFFRAKKDASIFCKNSNKDILK